MKYFLIVMVFLICGCSEKPNHNFYGTWGAKFKSGPTVEARYREDGTHDYFLDGKLFSSGKSVFKNDTLKTYDPICQGTGNYYATYTVDFFAKDSLRFTLIEDSCPPRAYDMDGAVMYRLKTK